MNFYALAAAFLLGGGVLIHVFLAGRTIHAEMQAALNGFPKALESLTWHAVSLWLALHCLLALVGAFYSNALLTGAIAFGAVHAATLGVLCLGVSRVLCQSWTAMRQGYVFLAIAAALGAAAAPSVV